jgi:hypothetical protein
MQNAKLKVQNFIRTILNFEFCIPNYRACERGQAMTELVIILPLLLMLCAGVASVVYMCWQGIKVQQAANLAARVEGQERVAGGVSVQAIQDINGTNGKTDDNMTEAQIQQELKNGGNLSSHQRQSQSVYGKFRQYILDRFGPGEQAKLLVPAPVPGQVGISDKVQVIRAMAPPSMFGLHIDPVIVTGTAYGGEDPNMYALPRWGTTTTPIQISNQTCPFPYAWMCYTQNPKGD